MTDPRLQDLQAAYDTGNLVVFAGAGLSAAAGLPTWHKLATDLLARLVAENKPPDAIAEVEDLLKKGQLIDALSAVKLALGPQEFDRAVEKACDDEGRDVPDATRAVAALAPKLRAVLTTNLDHFLERAFEGKWPALANATGDIASRRRYILKLHGTLLDHRTWVFSRDQYDRAVFASPTMRGAFETLFRTYPVLFVGCGLADDDLDQTFAAVRVLSGDQPPMHFALVPAGVPPFRRKTLEAAGLRLIEYENAEGKHGEVPKILRALAGASAPSPPAAPHLTASGGGAPPAAPRAPAAHRTELVLLGVAIQQLYDAAVAAGLVRSREALLSGIDPAFVTGLPDAPTPGSQLLSDLHAMNRVDRLRDGTVPLEVWLSNAVSIAQPRVEAEVFQKALEEVARKRP